MNKWISCLCLVALSSVCFAAKSEIAAEVLTIKTPEVVTTPTSGESASVYLELDNKGTKSHKLIAANSRIAKRTQLHRSVRSGNTERMRVVDEIVIKSAKHKTLKAGGFHVMLIGLKQSVKLGDKVPITLIFGDGSSMEVTADVVS